jgi:hypothetical protein
LKEQTTTSIGNSPETSCENVAELLGLELESTVAFTNAIAILTSH